MRGAWLAIALLGGCDTVQERPASWSYIHAAIIGPSCATASCHSAISSVAGMDLSTPLSAYWMLAGRGCDGPSLDGEPGLDYLTRFTDTLHGVGTRSNGDSDLSNDDSDLLMPPDQKLPDVEIELIERWVAAGAPCD